MKIGILGGTFNPPHQGHLVLANEIFEKLGLDKVLFVPTNIPPHKKENEASSEDRLNMVNLAIRGYKNFEVLDLEIKRGGVSYTIDTIRQLKSQYPEDDFYLIIGSDLANTFSLWKESDEIKKIVKVVVADRKNYPLKDKDDFLVVDITQIYLSSTQVRETLKIDESIQNFLAGDLVKYIKQHNLYK